MSQSPVIEHLNMILKNELTAINQYFLHAKMMGHMGFTKLHDYMRQESIDEMNHAEQLMQRIFYLGSMPNMQGLGKMFIGKNPKEILENDLKLEHIAIKDLTQARQVAEEAHDIGSIALLESILVSEEEHIDWIQQQLSVINTIGLEGYLQSQV